MDFFSAVWRDVRIFGKALQVEFASKENRPRRLYEMYDFHNFNDRTGFINLGYWDEDCPDLDTASEALADLVAEVGQFGAGQRILDVGFGYGDAALRWLRTRDPERITGINVTPVHVRAATDRARAAGLGDRADFRLGSATAMPFPDAQFDRVVALESAFHFVTREDFFAEAYRVLRPGGLLVTADIIPLESAHDMPGSRAWLFRNYPRENWYAGEDYRLRMAKAGFVDPETRSIRDQVYPPWSAFLARKLAEPGARGRMGSLFYTQLRARIGSAGNSPLKRELDLADYVIATSRKPS